MQPTGRNRQFIKKESYPQSQTWNIFAAVHVLAEEGSPQAQQWWLQNFLDKRHNDDKYRKSLSDIQRTEEQIIQKGEITLEDHSYMATWQERGRNHES